MDYSSHFNTKQTSQSSKVPGVKKQKRNNAGGISFKITKWEYMKRFLILGTEGGTYYVDEHKYTRDALKNVQKCINSDGKKAVDMIVDVSTHGEASDNDAAIFALAIAASCDHANTRKYALRNLTAVCRTGTHLFHFVKFIKEMRGFGRGLREALANWYTKRNVDFLAYQMLKYQQRDGWSHRDVIRLAHPTPRNKEMNKLFAYAVGKRDSIPKVSDYAKGARKIRKYVGSPEKAAKVVKEHRLTREVIPTKLLKEVCVWEAMLDDMPMMALVRNLGKMASMGMHRSFSDSLKMTVDKLTTDEAIKHSRIHPLKVMDAWITYKSGGGFRGRLNWEPSAKVMDALEHAFYRSFDNVEPTGKRILLALDVSGSMTSRLSGSLMNCREASAVLAMTTMRVESDYAIIAFTEKGANPMCGSSSDIWCIPAVSELPLTSNNTLKGVLDAISNLPFAGTDCALPMLYAKKRKYDVDAIVIYTDNETWAGDIHPWQALDQYQNFVGHEVKLIVVGMTATKFSIARPDYPNMLDVVGFSSDTPNVISAFIRE